MNRTGGPKLNVLAGIKSAHVSEYSYNEFVYSVTVKRTELDAKAFNLKFGASDDLTSFLILKMIVLLWEVMPTNQSYQLPMISKIMLTIRLIL